MTNKEIDNLKQRIIAKTDWFAMNGLQRKFAVVKLSSLSDIFGKVYDLRVEEMEQERVDND